MPDAVQGVWFSCLAMFGLELTGGVSWAVPLDIGGDFAGRLRSDEYLGKYGAAVSTTISGYLLKYYGLNAIFVGMSILAALGAILFARIDAGKADHVIHSCQTAQFVLLSAVPPHDRIPESFGVWPGHHSSKLRRGCSEFSNIQGLGQIRFPKGNIDAVLEANRRPHRHQRTAKNRTVSVQDRS